MGKQTTIKSFTSKYDAELPFAAQMLKNIASANKAASTGASAANISNAAVKAVRYFDYKKAFLGASESAHFINMLPPIEPRDALAEYCRDEVDLSQIKILNAELVGDGSVHFAELPIDTELESGYRLHFRLAEETRNFALKFRFANLASRKRPFVPIKLAGEVALVFSDGRLSWTRNILIDKFFYIESLQPTSQAKITLSNTLDAALARKNSTEQYIKSTAVSLFISIPDTYFLTPEKNKQTSKRYAVLMPKRAA